MRLELDSRPEAPAIVRAALAGFAQQLALDPDLFDDVKTAVSEACNNVVLYAYAGDPGPLVVGWEIGPEGVVVRIRDWGSGITHAGPSEERMGVGLAVISALADRAEFISPPEGGTEVRMMFAHRGAAVRPLARAQDAELGAGAPVRLTGDVVVTVCPVGLLGGVLGRVSRTVAARTHLSLDRFSDIYLVTDAIAALAESAASAAEISFAVAAAHKRLELAVGPFRAGNGGRLLESALIAPSGTGSAPILGDVALEPSEDYELLRVVIEDRRESTPPGGRVEAGR